MTPLLELLHYIMVEMERVPFDIYPARTPEGGVMLVVGDLKVLFLRDDVATLRDVEESTDWVMQTTLAAKIYDCQEHGTRYERGVRV